MSGQFQHIDLAYLEHMTDGDRAFQGEMLQMLIKAVREEVPRMRRLFASGDWRQLTEVSHRFKTTIGFSSCQAMIDANAGIEAAAESGTGRERLPDLLASLEAAQPSVLAELEAAAAALPTQS